MRSLWVVMIGLTALETQGAPVPTTQPRTAASPEVAALLSRIAALEATVARLEDQNRVLRAALVARKLPENPGRPTSQSTSLPEGVWTFADLERVISKGDDASYASAVGQTLVIPVKITYADTVGGNFARVAGLYNSPETVEGTLGSTLLRSPVGVEAEFDVNLARTLSKGQTVRMTGKIETFRKHDPGPGQVGGSWYTVILKGTTVAR